MNRAPYRTHSGRMLDLSLPDPDVLDLEDIAHNLARVCRFGGAVDGFYSVASHSVYVARRLQAEYGTRNRIAAAGLLHDATEAYLGDVTSGLKRLFPDYRELERRWEYAVERRYGVAIVENLIVKEADIRARYAEARDLFSNPYPPEQLDSPARLEPYAAAVVEQSTDEAEFEFMATARELGLFK